MTARVFVLFAGDEAREDDVEEPAVIMEDITRYTPIHSVSRY